MKEKNKKQTEQYSVLMTVYKSDNPEYFKESLDSMVKQTVLSNDIVIVKDGPVPKEIETIIKKYSKKFPGIINSIQLKENVGLGMALNAGLRECKNELIARMDADDISLPERCEKQLKMFQDDEALDIVGCPVKEFIDNTDNVVGVRNVPLHNEDIHKYCKKRDPFNHPTVMYRKSKVLLYGPYGDYRKNQDTDLWIKLLSNGCVCANHEEYLLFFRFDEKTYQKRKSWTNTKTLIEIRKNAWKIGFCSFFDFLIVATIQFIIYILPTKFQKYIYTNFLRR